MADTADRVVLTTARLEMIEPEPDATTVGLDTLQHQLLDRGVDVSALDLTAARVQDGWSLAALTRWVGEGSKVFASGHEVVRVPLFHLVAPAVEGATLEGTLAGTRESGAELTFTVAGSGLGAKARLVVENAIKLKTERPGVQVSAYVEQKFSWTQRQDRRNEDIRWFVVEPVREPGDLNVYLDEQEVPGTQVLDTALVLAAGVAGATVERTQTWTVEKGRSLTLGLVVETIGLDTSIEVSSASTQSATLTYCVPSGHDYRIEWLGHPSGVRVVTET